MIVGAAPCAHKHEKGQELSVWLLLQSNMGGLLHTCSNVSTLLQWEAWQIGGLTILVQTSCSNLLQRCFEHLMIEWLIQ